MDSGFYLILVFGGLAHIAFSFSAIADLFTKSQRELKFTWLVVILTVPFVGAMLYNKTKKRRRSQYWELK